MNKVVAFFKEISVYIIIIIVVLLIKTYVVAPIRVNGTSMHPTLYDKDIMILDKISYRFKEIERFDIVVIDYDDDFLIKRVIGLPGEKVEYKNNKLYINGKIIEENFSKEKTKSFNLKKLGINEIPEDYYFVLGDNRVNSKDSRVIGLISKEQILGKSSLTLFPFDRFGNKN